MSPDVFVFAGSHTWLGVRIDDLSDEKAGALKLRESFGALVTSVEEGSPAARAGIAENDVVVSYQGQRVESAATLRRFVRETPEDRTVSVGVMRDGSPKTFSVKIEARSHERHGIPRGFHGPDFNFKEFKFPGTWWSGGGPRLGVSVNDLNDQLAEYFGVKSGEGALVMEVMQGTPADKSGLKAGDVIVRIDDEAIGNPGDIREALRDKAGKDVSVTVVRNRKEMTLKASLEAEETDSNSSLTPELNDQIRDAIQRSHRMRPLPERIRVRNRVRDVVEI